MQRFPGGAGPKGRLGSEGTTRLRIFHSPRGWEELNYDSYKKDLKSQGRPDLAGQRALTRVHPIASGWILLRARWRALPGPKAQHPGRASHRLSGSFGRFWPWPPSPKEPGPLDWRESPLPSLVGKCSQLGGDIRGSARGRPAPRAPNPHAGAICPGSATHIPKSAHDVLTFPTIFSPLLKTA